MFFIELLRKQFYVFFYPNWIFFVRFIIFFIVSLINIIRDIIYKKVFSSMLFIFSLLFIILSFIYDRDSFFSVILGVFFTGLIFATIYFLSRKGIGLGDLFYMIFFSSAFGFTFGTIALILAFWIAFVVVIILLLFKQIDKSTRIPLIPFLFTGGILSLSLVFFL